MTDEELLKEFFQDDILEQKYLLNKAQRDSFMDHTGPKIIEIIKLAVSKIQDGEPEEEVARQLNTYLNK